MTPAAPLLASLLLLIASAPARADLEGALASHPDGAALRALWLEGQQLERDHLPAAAERWERLVQALPGEAEPHWRLARAEWRRGERLPLGQKAARLDRFRRARDLAAQGLGLDPRCACASARRSSARISCARDSRCSGAAGRSCRFPRCDSTAATPGS